MNEHVHRIAEALLGKARHTFSDHQLHVVRHIAEKSSISRNVNATFADRLTVGERAADAVAKFGGSWTFIILFGAFLATWALLNVLALGSSAFDPYPFIFLNLLLSMLAALQAPIIMMSQNRQSAKDRLAVEHDYEVNLKAEIEICQVLEKLDEVRIQKLSEVIDLHKKQIALLEELAASSKRLEDVVRPSA